MNKRKISFTKWLDLRAKIFDINEPLVTILDQVDPKDQPLLIEIDYLYGDTIIKNGELQIPSKNDTLVSLKNSNVRKEFIDALSYQRIPLFMNIKNDNEVFIDNKARSIPLNLFKAGSLLGLFETANYIFDNPCETMWSVSAGARTIFMLPKISNEIGLKRLHKYYNIPTTLGLKELTDHFEIFKLIASSDNFSQAWINKVLFFTKKWLDPAFLKKYPEFKNYLLKQCWLQAQFAIEKVKVDLIWEKFSEAIALKRLNPGPFLTNHAKHLINIVVGSLPSFYPTGKSQTEAPITGIQRSIMDIYGLKNNMPIIMSICEKKQYRTLPLYYSLSYPTILEGSPLNKSHTTISETLRYLKILMDNFKEYVKFNKLEKSVLDCSTFEYIHTGQDLNKYFLLSNELIDQSDFSGYKKIFPNLSFPYASYFWNGCIKITFNVD